MSCHDFLSSCCGWPYWLQEDTVSFLLMQPLRLMESPLIQQVIILRVSRKFLCAMKTKSYNDNDDDNKVDDNDDNEDNNNINISTGQPFSARALLSKGSCQNNII